MGFGDLNVGQKLPLNKTFKKAVATAALAGTLGLVAFMGSVGPALSGGETRTISMVHQHTGESITVTYKVNGNYVPSAMKKLNYLLRDWRRNEVVRIDPRTIDLIWELHADLGSKKPVHIVCGYRSTKTNAFLKRIGRKVAGKSQHTKGTAIDFYFPDVNTKNIRNMALAHGLGGVGYYRSAGGPTGFLHADSGNVRHWGPAISRSQLAAIIKDGRRKMGRYSRTKGGGYDASADTMVADSGGGKKKSGSFWDLFRGKKSEPDVADVPETQVAAADVPPVDGFYGGEDDELAALSEDAAATTAAEAKAAAKAKKPTPVVVADVEPAFVEPQPDKAIADKAIANKDRGALAGLARTAMVEQQAEQKPVAASLIGNIPLPKLKPKAVLTMASLETAKQDVVISPVSAEPEQTWKHKSNRPSPVADAIGTVEDAPSMAAVDVPAETSASGKGSLDTGIRNASLDESVVIEPVVSTKSEPSWISAIFSSAEASLRKDGVQPSSAAITSMPLPAILGPDGSGQIEIAAPVSAEGKGDAQFVNREGKSSLPPLKLRLSSRQ